MKISNGLAIFLAILFTLTLLPSSVGALTYRSDLNNGSWSGYIRYNRDFSTNFYLSSFSDNVFQCSEGWCFACNIGSSNLHYVTTKDGNTGHLYKFGTSMNHYVSMMSQYELVGGKEISVTLNGTGSFYSSQDSYYGYFDESNTFYSIGAFRNFGTYTYDVPVGKYRVGLKLNFLGNLYITNFLVDGSLGDEDSYFAPDNSQATFNRGFETPFSITSSGNCSSSWCGFLGAGGTIATSTEYKTLGTYSAKLHQVSWATDPTILSSLYEITTDAEIVFDTKGTLTSNCGSCPVGNDCSSHIRFGYIDDSNNFTAVKDISNGCDSGYTFDFNDYSIKIPHGSNKRFAVALTFGDAYIDNVRVLRNNVGTFFKGVSAPSCSSISGCSNVTSASDLKSNATRDLYWIVDYVSGASCDVYENGELQLFNGLHEMGSSGLYYYKIQSKAFPSNDVNVLLSANCLRLPYDSKGFIAEAQIFNDTNIQTTMTTGNTGVDNFGIRGDIVTFWSKYYDDLGGAITDATCTLTIDGITNAMTYNSSTGRYEYQKGFITDATYPVVHDCSKGNYATQSTSYNFVIGDAPAPFVENVTFTNISNASYSINDSNIQIRNNSTGDIIFSMVALESGNAKVVWSNPNRAKSYLIYTSSDGIDWAINDTLNYGSPNTYDDGMQKLPSQSTYVYSFIDSVSTTKKYYKLELFEPVLSWETTKDSPDWIKVSQPSEYIDANGFKWDIYNHSINTPMVVYTRDLFPELSVSGGNSDFIVRFNAYITDASNVPVGVKRKDGQDNYKNAYPLSYAKTFSIPSNSIQGNYEFQIGVSDSEATSFQVYISDIEILPRAYFVEPTTLKTQFGETLPSILYNFMGTPTSSQYLLENAPFRMYSKAVNTGGLVDSVRTDILINSTIAKTYSLDVSNVSPNAQINLNKVLEGVINYIVSDKDEVISSIKVTNTLLDDSGRSIAESSATYLFLEYPYFANDIKVSMQNLKSKVGQSPSFNFSLEQKVPSAFIGVEFSVYEYALPYEQTEKLFSKIIYADELGCSNLYTCSRQITLDEFKYEGVGNYSILANVVLITQDKSSVWNNDPPFPLNNPLRTGALLQVYPSLTTLETARILQVFERTNHVYKTNEPVPLVFQARNDELTNMKNDYLIELTSTDSGYTESSVSYQASKFIYDEITGYNYWFFNPVFTNVSGGVLYTGDSLAPMVRVSSLTGTTGATPLVYGMTDKCTGYPADLNYFFNGTFLQSWFGLGNEFKCQVDAPSVAMFPSVEFIDFNSDFVPEGNQTHSVFCVRTDINREYSTTLGDDFVCGVFYKKSEEQIDKFKVYLGNSFSDYSKSGAESQYIAFEIPQEQIMFNDILMLKASLNASYSTDRIDTAGELLFAGFNKILPNFQGLVDFTQDNFINTNFLNFNAGMDVNLNEAINPNYISGLFFFKIGGLKVINQNDFVADHDELAYSDPSNFRTWALQNNIALPKKEATIQIYSTDMKIFNSFKTSSPLIIFEKPSQKNSSDVNAVVVPTDLKFTFITDMVSANFTKTARAYVPLVFSYSVPNAPFSLTTFLEGVDSLVSDPVGTAGAVAVENWFLIVILIAGALIGSVIYLNLKVASGK